MNDNKPQWFLLIRDIDRVFYTYKTFHVRTFEELCLYIDQALRTLSNPVFTITPLLDNPLYDRFNELTSEHFMDCG